MTKDEVAAMDLRDFLASKASEKDIYEFQFGPWEASGPLRVRRQVRTREEAKYAYADAMIKARTQ